MQKNFRAQANQYLKTFVRKIFTYLFKIEVKGLENYPAADEPIVIIANHVSLLDGVILWLYLPHEVTFVVDPITIEKWWARWTKKFGQSVSLDPTKTMALKALIAHVANNNHCVIFPEGRITKTGGLMKVYGGPGLIADHAKAKILPIHIDGPQYSYFSRLKKQQKLHLFPKTKITIFPTKILTVSSEIKGKQRRKLLSEQLYDILCEIDFQSQDTSKTLFQSILESQKLYGANKIILEDIALKKLTYRQLIMRSYLLAELLQNDVAAKETVGIFLPSVNAYVALFFALQLNGCIPTLLNPSMSEQRIVECCKTAALKTIFSSRKFLEIPQLKEKVTEMQNTGFKVIFIDDYAEQASFSLKASILFKSFFPAMFYKKWEKILHSCQQTADSTAVILFTSGSEGDPKGVALSYRNLQANRFQLLTKISFTPNDIIFNALPLFHVFSLNAGLLVPILSGLKVFLYPNPLHIRKIPEYCYSTNPTVLFSTDTFLANYGKFAHPYDFFNLRYVFAGAEKLKESTYLLWLTKFGLRIFEGYGTTETSPLLAANNPQQNKNNTVGKLVPGIEYQFKNVEGIEHGGELWVKGPNIMQGYMLSKNPGVISPLLAGWHATGDVAYLDSEGYLIIADRLKRFAKVGGEMISLTEVENCLSKLWPGFHHAAVSITDARKGEQIVLITTYPYATRKDIISRAHELGLSNLSIPKSIHTIDRMPLLPTGKIDYRSLHQLNILNT